MTFDLGAILILVTPLLGVLALYVRSYLQYSKSLTSNYNDAISRLEKVLDIVETELKSYHFSWREQKKKLKSSRELIVNGRKLKLKREDNFNSYRESCRLLALGRIQQIKKIAQSIKEIRPEIFGIPNDKITGLKKAQENYFEDHSYESFVEAIKMANELYAHYQRQADIGVTLLGYLKAKGLRL